MRILLLNQFYPPDVAATGQLLRDLADALAARGHEAHVLASQRTYAGGGHRLAADETARGVRIHRLAATGFGRAGLLGRAVDYLSFYLLAWRRMLQLPRMDVCVSLTTPPLIGLLGAMLGRRRKTPLVLWTMDVYPEIAVTFGVFRSGGAPHRFFAWLSRRLYRAAAKVVALGEVMVEVLQAAGCEGGKITVVHNWVPGEAVRRTEPPLGEMITLQYSGNLGLGHELETALRAVARLTDRSHLCVQFIGHGKLRRRLETLVEDLNLRCVTFLPPRPLAKLSASLAEGDIHLISQREGTQGLLVPSKLYGILAAGRAAVYIGPADTEVAAAIRQAKAGLLVEPGDVGAAAEALQTLMDDPARREVMGRAARAAYDERFGRDKSIPRLVEIIESCAPSLA
jgi:glycosyltransferase involved in cell wall biosynthesis